MKIDAARVIVCSPGRNFVTLKIETDQGVHGIGDATLNGRELSVVSYLEDHVIPTLIGRDPRRIEDIWQYLYRGAYWRRGPVTMRAIAAVDVALWDIKAKMAGMPLCDLLGGRSRDRVLVYGHANGDDLEGTVEAVGRYVELGYKAIRAQSGVPGIALCYGVGRGELQYEPADAALPTETVWDTTKYLNFIPKLFDRLRTNFGFDHHLLHEMVNAGLIPATVADDYLADFWKQVFPKLVLHDKAPLRTGGQLAVAIRKNSPRLAAELNDFIGRFGLHTAMGRILGQRYLQDTKFVTNAASTEDRARFQGMVNLFRKYGDEYEIDYLLMAAQGYQESRLDQRANSPVGAVGVMQLMPATGQEQQVGDITQLEPNIHAGVKYMRFMMDEYFKDEPMDQLNKGLFTFASYNAGPGRIRRLRHEAAERGLDPNIWFGNVEQIASERIGRETVTYVSNIYKYYVAYRLITQQQEERRAAKALVASGSH